MVFPFHLRGQSHILGPESDGLTLTRRQVLDKWEYWLNSGIEGNLCVSVTGFPVVHGTRGLQSAGLGAAAHAKQWLSASSLGLEILTEAPSFTQAPDASLPLRVWLLPGSKLFSLETGRGDVTYGRSLLGAEFSCM